MQPRQSKSRNRQRDPRVTSISRWEWLSGGLGLFLVLTTLGYIGYNAMTSEPSVPAVTIDHLSTEPTPGGYVVTFRARNSGPSTAASLEIRGDLSNGSRIVETSEVTLDYLPPGASDEAVLSSSMTRVDISFGFSRKAISNRESRL